MDKHTPGPWVVDDESQVIAGNRVVAQVFGPCEPSNCVDIDREWADACLIAAAPELLEALEALIDEAHPIRYDQRKAMAHAAVAKARGERA
jgi:hypothetical protein